MNQSTLNPMIATSLAILLLVGAGCTSGRLERPPVTEDLTKANTTQIPLGEGNKVLGEVKGTDFDQPGEVMITDVGNFGYEPANVRTVRPDLFRDGHFSVFDILVHLHERGDIQMVYHLDEDMDTHVIDTINGESSWWTQAYYDGGWPENNVYRMDHYPHKDRMYVRLYHQRPEVLERIYATFRAEVARKRANNGTVIVPDVIIRGPTADLRFINVPITPHDLRTDTFRKGTITAIDVIMSLGDLGRLTYDLKWYDSIGAAGIVRSYWVHRIDKDESYSTCGFVYEAGEPEFDGFRGNHIHIPTDTRIITSPAYVEFFWICL